MPKKMPHRVPNPPGKLNEYDLMFERLEGAKMIIPGISGYDNARRRALEVAAYMEIVEGRPLTEKQFADLYRDFREEEGYTW